MQRTAHLRTSGTSYRSRGEISCGQCYRVFDNAASCLMHQQMHLQNHTCPSGLWLYMSSCTFLPSFTAMDCCRLNSSNKLVESSC